MSEWVSDKGKQWSDSGPIKRLSGALTASSRAQILKVTQLLDEGSIFQYCPAGMDGGRTAVVAKQTQPTWSIALPSRWRNTFKNDLFNIEHTNHNFFVCPQVLRNVLLYHCSNHAASGNCHWGGWYYDRGTSGNGCVTLKVPFGWKKGAQIKQAQKLVQVDALEILCNTL